MGTLVSEVFRFVQLRSTNNTATQSSTGGGVEQYTPKFINFKYSDFDSLQQEYLDESAYKKMVDVIASSDTDKRSQIDTISTTYKEANTANFWSGLEENTTSIIDFANWVASGNGLLDKATLETKLEETTGKLFSDWNSEFDTESFLISRFTVWNLLIAELVVKKNDFTLYQLNQFLTGVQIIKSVNEVEELPETEEEQTDFLSPQLVLPEIIFPLPRYQRIREEEPETEQANNTADDYQTCEMIVKHGQSIIDLLDKFIAFIRSSQAEKQKLAMLDFVFIYDENGIPTNGDDMPNTNFETITIDLVIEYLPKFPSLYAEMINCDSVVGGFLKTIKFETPEGEETNDLDNLRNVLENQNYVTFPMTYGYFEEQIQILKNTFQKRITDYYAGQENVYVQTGTSIVKIEKAPKKTPRNGESNNTTSEANSEAGAPQLLERSGDTDPFNLIDTLYDDEALDAMIKVGDFMKVEQSVSCYEAGEVAHIENVMIGETRSKKTRRLEREERTTETETIKEEEQERDLQTTERFEMSREAEKVMNQDMNFDVSLSASGKVGPMQITASTGFGFSQSTQQSQKSAQQYAQSVVERARNRTYSKVRNYEKVTVLREFEDTNLHEFKNEQSELNPTPQNNVGIYRWVDKVYKNKLINYGRRLMIEMYIPDPSAMHRFLTQNQPIDSALEPSLPNIADANAITETNYVSLCSKYGVDGVEWPKKSITKSEVYTYMPTDKSTEKTWGSDAQKQVKYSYPTFDYSQGDTKLIIIDEGYESTDVIIKIAGGMLKDGTAQGNGTVSVLVAGDAAFSLNAANYSTGNSNTPLKGHMGNVPVAINTWGVVTYNVTVIIKCTLTANAENAFKLDLYNKIMQAYERKKADFDRKLNAMKQSANKQYGNNPGTNRVIEKQELKRNFIELFNNNSSYFNQFVSHYKNTQLGYPDLDTYRHWAKQPYQAPKFFEDSFEWSLMNYSFLPYFWNGRDYKNESRWGQNSGVPQNTLADSRWTNVYNAQDTDPIFLSFLQAGYAKVVVPVSPGSEAAVLNYLQTENIALNLPLKPTNKVLEKAWNEVFNTKIAVPAIDKPIQIGKDWETRVPTNLVILQTSAQGVPGTGLPCWKSDPETLQGRFGDLIKLSPVRFTP